MSFKARTWGDCLCPCFPKPKQSGEAKGDKGKDKDHTQEPDAKSCSFQWTSAINKLHRPFLWLLKVLTSTAATYPLYTMGFVTMLAAVFLTTGLLTSFSLETNETVLWTPQNSQSMIDAEWTARRGYMGSGRYLTLFFHANGKDVLGQAPVERIFEAVDRIRNLPGYEDMCAKSWYYDRNGERTCEIEGVTRFWNSDRDTFERETSSDQDVIEQISALTYPDEMPIREDRIFGQPQRESDWEFGQLESLKSYFVYIYLPYSKLSDDFETVALDEAFALEKEWKEEDQGDTVLTIEIKAGRSFNDEFLRGIYGNLPLIAVVAVIMILFACLVFYKRHRLYSRVMVGLAAVAAVMLSMMTAFGIVMLCGIPFTTVSILIPFILFGIGMDDAFIIYGDYSRTDHNADPVKRIEHTIDDVGVSITLTTITSTFAFGIGCISDIPAVSWLCFYAFPSVLSVYFYQLTFFVAAIVIDERRIKARRQDPFFCCKYRSPAEKQGIMRVGSSDSEENLKVVTQMDAPEESKVDSFMAAYGEFLLRPNVKKLVIVIFTILSIAGIVSASQLEQEFEYADVLPDDSYLADFYAARKAHAVANQLQVGAYFRYVDQSSIKVQEQMKDFVADLVEMDGVSGEPDFFWLREFETFVEETPFVQNLEFNDQLGFFLGVPLYAELFRPDIRLDADGNILSSRVLINMYDVDQEDVKQQIDMLSLQRQVSLSQPINHGRNELAFFTSSSEYNEWEFYSAAVDEMILTAILGIFCVSAIAFISIPHWTAVLFVFPLISVLYVNLLGVMQWGGVPVSAISYVTMAMAIGLMVDFIIHVLLRYYESPGNRHEKTIATLRTMGSSILVGGLSTFLGTLPLLFSTYNMFRAVFLIFLGLVTLGMGFGLILLPVLLSIVGTEEQVTTKAHSRLARNVTMEESDSDYSAGGSPISRLGGSLFEAADDVTVFLIGYIMAQTRDTTKSIGPRPDPPYEKVDAQAPLLFIPSPMATDSGTESDSDEENSSSEEGEVGDIEAQKVVEPEVESGAPSFRIVGLAPTQTNRDLFCGSDDDGGSKDEASEKAGERDPSVDSDEEESGSQIEMAKDHEKDPLIDSDETAKEAGEDYTEHASEPVDHDEEDQAKISEEAPQDVDATDDAETPAEENEPSTVQTKDEPANDNIELASEPVDQDNEDRDNAFEEHPQNLVAGNCSEKPSEENDANFVSDRITEDDLEQESGHAADDLSAEDKAGDSDEAAQVENTVSSDIAAQDDDANEVSEIEAEQTTKPVVQVEEDHQEEDQADDMDEPASEKPAEIEREDAIVTDVDGVADRGNAKQANNSDEPSQVGDAAVDPEKSVQDDNPDVASNVETERNSPVPHAVDEHREQWQPSHVDGGNSASTDENVGEEIARSSDPPEGGTGRTEEQVGSETSARRTMKENQSKDPTGVLGKSLDEVFC